MRCRQTPIIAMVTTVWLFVTTLTPTAQGLTAAAAAADLDLSTDSVPASTFGSDGSSKTTESESTAATPTDSKPATTSVTASSMYANVTLTTVTITSTQTLIDSATSTANQGIVTNSMTTTAASVTELKVTDLQNLTSTAAKESKDLHSATSNAPWEAQVTTLMPTAHGLAAAAADLDVSTDSGPASTFGSDGSSKTTESESTVATPTDSKPGTTSVTASSMYANVTLTTVTIASTQTLIVSATSTATQSIVTNSVTTTAASVTELKVTDFQNSTPTAATESKDLHSATSNAPWEAQGASASQKTTVGPFVDRANDVINGSIYKSQSAAIATSVASLEDGSTIDVVPTASTQSTQSTVVAIVPHNTISTASILPSTAIFYAENATQLSLVQSTAAQEITSATTSASLLELSGTSSNEPTTRDSTLRDNYTTTSYSFIDDQFSADTVTVTSASSTRHADIHVAKRTETEHITRSFVTLTTVNGGAASAVISAALATFNQTESSVTESATAQVSNWTTSYPSSWATLGTSDSAADIYSPLPHSKQPANVSEKAALLPDDTSTSASAPISAKMDVTATSTTWFDRLLSTASQHDGATTAHASFDNFGATQTQTPPTPTLFTGGGSSTPELVAWSPGLISGQASVALIVIIASVVFAGAALITCAFIFIKCCTAVRTSSTKKRRGGSHKENASCEVGRSWPRQATSPAWRQACEVAAAGANGSLRRSAALTAAETATEDGLLSLWAGSNIAGQAAPRHTHSQVAMNTEREQPGMLGDDLPNGQLNDVELSPFAASPPGTRWPLTTFRGLSADCRAPVTSHSPAYMALKGEVDDPSSTERGETQKAVVNHYVFLPDEILAQTKL